MEGCWLEGAYLLCTNLTNANLEWACLEDLHYFTQTDYEGTPILEGCADCSFEDANEDGYDDMSYAAAVESVDVGYMNGDGENNVIDVVMLVDSILNP